MKQINALSLAHDFITAHVKPGSFCIDATAGRGRDTAFLCRLAGPNGMVYAFDIQKEALDSTRTLLENEGLSSCARLIHDSHANMAVYARPESADCIVFNLGWLPGGDHDIHTDARSSVKAIEQGLAILKDGAVMSICIYYGRNNGYDEKDAVLAFLSTLDAAAFTVIVHHFHNRGGDVAIPVSVIKQG